MRKRKGPAPKVYTCNGISDDLDGWVRRTGISKGALKNRLRLRWPFQRVFMTPVKVRSPKGAPRKPRKSRARGNNLIVVSAEQIFRAWARSSAPETIG